ncbi:MAG: hypothetical protein AMJ94_09715 [Deltaproteobacteria bacterium SM23_61]|nr:MAG: hypothetical protein AMJ94_09715 [Deltaproteobacteria bacterium SM23_61]
MLAHGMRILPSSEGFKGDSKKGYFHSCMASLRKSGPLFWRNFEIFLSRAQRRILRDLPVDENASPR